MIKGLVTTSRCGQTEPYKVTLERNMAAKFIRDGIDVICGLVTAYGVFCRMMNLEHFRSGSMTLKEFNDSIVE